MNVACVRACTSLKGFGADCSAVLEANRAPDKEATCCLWRWYVERCDFNFAWSLSWRAWICLCWRNSSSYSRRIGPMRVICCLWALTAASYSAWSELEGLGFKAGDCALGSWGETVAIIGDWLERCERGRMGRVWVDGSEDERTKVSVQHHRTSRIYC